MSYNILIIYLSTTRTMKLQTWSDFLLDPKDWHRQEGLQVVLDGDIMWAIVLTGYLGGGPWGVVLMNPLSTYPQRQRKYSGELCSTFWHLEFETLSECVSQRCKLNKFLLRQFQERISVFQDFKYLIYSEQPLTLRSRISKRKNSLNKNHMFTSLLLGQLQFLN